jgi:beta-fructofuranosidase
MALALADKWIWDFWLFRDGDDWHCYFLQADKKLGDPELRHRHVTQGHAVSRNLRDWTHLGTCLQPAAAPAFDDWTTWTGSVVRDAQSLWHLFFTGTQYADGGYRQRIGHAASLDGHNWQRIGNGLCLDLTGDAYEDFTPGHWHDRAFRDPWVIRNPEGSGWLMYFTARVPGVEEPNAGGAIGLARSDDLTSWTLEPPVYAGGAFGQMEVPQVFRLGRRWYMMFCTDAGHWSEAYRAYSTQEPVTGTHYLVADHHLGPWRVAPGPFFDGSTPCRRYSGKVIDSGEGLVTMGFIYYGADGGFVGEVCDPIPVSVDADGFLHAHPERAGKDARI